ncbi:MAG TPA: DUF4198 domain-containing protein [Chitinophagaceae bacterium]|jgi:hypothetical protein|nr:DUF4198 domain-containing protein [Chitinophagaceae bacterium]
MKKILRYLSIILVLSPLNVLAHGYWIELEGNHQVKQTCTIKLIFGEYHLAEKLSGNKLDRMKDIRVTVVLPNGKQQTIAMKQLPECWQGTFIPETDGIYAVLGINDEREVQDWTQHGLGIVRPIQYLKAVYEVGKTAKNNSVIGHLFDIDITKNNTGNYELYLSKDKKPVDTCYIAIVNPAGEEEEAKTDVNGKATFTTKADGLYLISIEWIDKTPGSFKGKEYKTIRHRIDYSLYSK